MDDGTNDGPAGESKSGAAAADGNVSSEMDAGGESGNSEAMRLEKELAVEPRAYNFYYYRYLTPREKMLYILDERYLRRTGMVHARCRNIISLEAYKRHLQDVGLSLLSPKFTRFDQTFTASLPPSVLEHRTGQVLAISAKDKAAMTQLTSRIYEAALKHLDLSSVYPTGEKRFAGLSVQAAEAPYQLLQSILRVLVTKLRKEINDHEQNVREEYTKLPDESGSAQGTNLEDITAVVSEELGRGSLLHLKKLAYNQYRYNGKGITFTPRSAGEKGISEAQAMGAAAALKEIAQEEKKVMMLPTTPAEALAIVSRTR